MSNHILSVPVCSLPDCLTCFRSDRGLPDQAGVPEGPWFAGP